MSKEYFTGDQFDPEQNQESNKGVRFALLALAADPEKMHIHKDRQSLVTDTEKLYTPEDARALQYLIMFHESTKQIEATVGHTMRDQEAGAFIFNETDTRQLQKAIDTFKNRILPRIEILQESIEKDEEKKGPSVTTRQIKEKINLALREIEEYLPSLEIILSGQPGYKN